MTTEDRISRLERNNRYMMIGVVALFMLTIWSLTRLPNNIRAKRFELIDEEGSARAILSHDGKGGPNLRMMDAQGRASIWLNAGLRSFWIEDAAGSVRISPSNIEITDYNLPRIELGLKREREDKTDNSSRIIATGTHLSLRDKTLKNRASLVANDKEAALFVWGKDTNSVAALSVMEAGVGVLLKNEHGHSRSITP